MESHLIPTHFQREKKLSSKKSTNTPFSLAFYQSNSFLLPVSIRYAKLQGLRVLCAMQAFSL